MNTVERATKVRDYNHLIKQKWAFKSLAQQKVERRFLLIIWLALLIPALTIVTMFIFGKGRLTLWEGAVMLFVPLLLIGVFKWNVESYQVSDTEWWGNIAVNANYYEDWNEYIHQTCTRSCCCTTDSKGNTTCGTETYDCSYVAYYPEYWTMESNGGQEVRISQGFYKHLVQRWGNQTFVDMRRNYHTNDGDAYKTVFDNIFEHTEPIISEHSYVNKVAASDSIFNFRDMDSKEVKKLGLFEYPKLNGWRQSAILGYEDPAANQVLEIINGHLGASKQVKVIVLVWKNRPKTIALDQQQYWKNGNKNEFVVNIGIDDANNVKWAYVFSWTKSENLKIAAREYFNDREGQALNLVEFANWLKPELEQKWVRTRFREFNYITVEPPLWAVLTTYIISLLLTGGIGFWCWSNEHTCEDSPEERSYIRTRFR